VTPLACPHCKANLRGDRIAEPARENYGMETHFSRVIGISDGESVRLWQCPDCGHKWPRIGPSGRGYRTFNLKVRGRAP
jgi:hypothetical protein